MGDDSDSSKGAGGKGRGLPSYLQRSKPALGTGSVRPGVSAQTVSSAASGGGNPASAGGGRPQTSAQKRGLPQWLSDKPAAKPAPASPGQPPNPDTGATTGAQSTALARDAMRREMRGLNRRELLVKTLTGLIAGAIAWIPMELRVHGKSLTADPDLLNYFTFSLLKNDVEDLLILAMVGGVIATVDTRTRRLSLDVLKQAARNYGICIAALIIPLMIRDVGFTELLRAGGWAYQTNGSFPFLVAARILAWSIEAAGVGIGVGLANGSRPKLATAALGGMLGGFLAGLLFDPLDMLLRDFLLASGETPGLIVRFLGNCLQGLGIGLGIGIAWEVTKDAWFSIAKGPMSGQQFSLDRAVSIIGRAERNAVPLFGDAQVLPQQARVVREGQGYLLEGLGREPELLLNGKPTRNASLASGDRLQIGGHELVFRARAGTLALTRGELLAIGVPAASVLAVALALLVFELTQPASGSREWLEARAGRGDANAQASLCQLYFEGNKDIAADHAKALPFCKAAAEKAVPIAEYYLGALHERGEASASKEPDYAQARVWMTKAAGGGIGEAAVEMGVMCEKGWGDAPDDIAARRWYQQAADKGVVLGQYRLGVLAALGRGGPKDYALAYKLILPAAEKDIPAAQWDLGMLYAQGNAPESSTAKACSWMKKAVSNWRNSRIIAADQLERAVEQVNRLCGAS